MNVERGKQGQNGWARTHEDSQKLYSSLTTPKSSTLVMELPAGKAGILPSQS